MNDSNSNAGVGTAIGGLDQDLGKSHGVLAARYAEPVVVKHGNLFLLCDDAGDVRPGSEQGLYFHDMRFLSSEALRVNGLPLVSLLAEPAPDGTAIFQLTNPDIPGPDGTVRVRKERLSIRRQKRLGGGYEQTLKVTSHASEQIELTLTLDYAADFADMFVVRGARPGRRGTVDDPEWIDDALVFRYRGADEHVRRLVVRCEPRPDGWCSGRLTFRISLRRGETWCIRLDATLFDHGPGPVERVASQTDGARPQDLRRARAGATADGCRVRTSHALFNEVLARSFADLHMLAMRQLHESFFAAGVPWYVALFGRDSLLTSVQMLAFDHRTADQTLHVLASHQSTRLDDWRDEQPGKILHELRVGEMANLGEIPQSPYYGTVDATPLFLILLGECCNWLGSLELFDELRDAAMAALAWIEQYGDEDGDGYIDYRCRSERGLRNQGWKDSWNGVVMGDGRLAEPPIALVEVQGYVYRAWRSAAWLLRHSGDAAGADRLDAKAADLYARFNRDFWMPDLGYYAFCRQGDGRFSNAVASNAAHALWTGIVDPARAADVVARAMAPDMFNGWGLRTLSSDDASYNPVDYQVGSVWPHDTSFAVAGMCRYGHKAEAAQIFTGMVQAAARFAQFRLPETFAGYDRTVAGLPVRYPVACNPQAWAAASVPFMLASLLGIVPDGCAGRVRLVRPYLPEWLSWVEISGLRAAGGSVDVRFERHGGATTVASLRQAGGAVQVEW